MTSPFGSLVDVLDTLCTRQDEAAQSFTLDDSHHEPPQFMSQLVETLGQMIGAVDADSITVIVDRLQSSSSARFRGACLRFLMMLLNAPQLREQQAAAVSLNLYRLVTLIAPPGSTTLKQELLGFLTLCSCLPLISKAAVTNSRKYVDALATSSNSEPSKVNVSGSQLADPEYPPVGNGPAARGRRRILLPHCNQVVVCTNEQARKAEGVIERMRAEQKQEQVESRLIPPGQSIEQEFDQMFDAQPRVSPATFVEQWKTRSLVENSFVNPYAFSAPD